MSDLFDDRFFEESDKNTWNYDDNFSAGSGSSSERTSGKKNRKKKHPMAAVVASALVFGLVAGTATYAVNYAEAALASKSGAQTDVSLAEVSQAEDNQTSDVSAARLAVQSGEESAAGELTSVAKTESGEEMTVSQVADAAMPSMVTISTMSVQEMQSYFGFGQTQAYEVQGAGTGIIVGETDEELLIATNDHVISGAREMSVGFVDESVAEAYLKGTDAENDLAIIAVQKSDLSEETLDQIRVVAIGDSDQLALGEQVVAIGNALGYGQSVTSVRSRALT